MSKSFLFVVWAGGGNVPPQLTLARRLAARGHAVRMLAPAVLREKIERAGVVYEPYGEAPEHDEAVPERSLVRDFEQRSPLGAAAAARDNLLAGMAGPVAADVLSALERHRIDVVAADFNLFGALFAAEKAQVPAAMLVHTIYPFPGPGRPPFGTGWAPMAGPLGTLRDAVGRQVFRRIYERPLLPPLNEVRARLGLSPLTSLSDLLERPDRILVLTSRAFDFPGELPSNVRYIGPQLEEPEWTPPWDSPWPSGDPRPLVVVGLTTTYQAHSGLLQRIVSALGALPVRALVTTGRIELGEAPPNVHLASFVPHPRVLPQAAAVVTHAGLGTVHAALAHGLPLVCLPIGRDQPDNAARVVWRGAGLRLSPKSSPAQIAVAVERVLQDEVLSRSARHLAREIADEHPADIGPSEIERLATTGTATIEPGPAPSGASTRRSMSGGTWSGPNS
jgi:UDP:flavonoid glycosyltransferase YjiC (YdhE family)